MSVAANKNIHYIAQLAYDTLKAYMDAHNDTHKYSKHTAKVKLALDSVTNENKSPKESKPNIPHAIIANTAPCGIHLYSEAMIFLLIFIFKTQHLCVLVYRQISITSL